MFVYLFQKHNEVPPLSPPPLQSLLPLQSPRKCAFRTSRPQSQQLLHSPDHSPPITVAKHPLTPFPSLEPRRVGSAFFPKQNSKKICISIKLIFILDNIKKKKQKLISKIGLKFLQLFVISIFNGRYSMIFSKILNFNFIYFFPNLGIPSQPLATRRLLAPTSGVCRNRRMSVAGDQQEALRRELARAEGKNKNKQLSKFYKT